MDRCWTVPVTMAASAFLICMPWTWFGLLLVMFVEKFDVTRETASWPKSAATMLSHLSGLVVYALQRRIKTFYIVLFSTMLTSVAFISAAFAPNMLWMTITVGVIHGLGHGIFLTSSTVYTLLHFVKYRTIATSFIFIAYGLSAVVSQFVLTGLMKFYDLKGALLLYGGILLNSFVIVMLAWNPSPIRLPCKQNSHGCLENALPTERNYGATGDGNASWKSSENRRCSDLTDEAAQPESSTLKHVLALFSTPSFYVLLGAILVGDYTGVEFLSTIVDYGVDKGFELGSAQHLVTFSSAGQLVGRIIVPVLADCVPFTRRPLYAFSLVTFGVCMMTMPLVDLILPALALATLAGVAQGYILCIRYVLLAEYLGVERTAASSGIVGVAMVPMSLVSPVIIGHFRDATGSYDSYYQMLGIISLVAAVFFATHDFCQKKSTRDAHSQ
ncbi:monocarboxylate transporter 1-like [Dermacentor andersoni]|uniref:monocarboxylate transporter 1-like n=1 Tax=Dermacentor andersoni TaxID=34620 RepID=UPI002416D0B4|nr:monocarboxylate transporter 12-B-like [Dermacentor andersoni]